MADICETARTHLLSITLAWLRRGGEKLNLLREQFIFETVSPDT